VHPLERIAYRTAALKQAGLWRDPADGDGCGAPGAIDTRSNDYLGLASRVVSRETVPGGGARLGAAASRSVSGTWDEHVALEAALAEWLGTEACLLFSSGYAANVGALSALVGPGETVISDALNHASIIDGCRLSRARTVIIPHGDLEALERALADTPGVRWVVFESYYGMDGDSPDLERARRICNEGGAALIVDEAHAIGLFGPEGRGLCAQRGVGPDVLVGGLGKAFGAQGGFVATTSLLRDWLWNRARSFVFSTGTSPILSSLVLDRLRAVRGAESERQHLARLTARLEERLLTAGVALPAGRHGPIFPVIFGDEHDVLAAARATATAGVRCQPIRPPTVPAGSSRLRVILNAAMSDADVEVIANALEAAWLERKSGESAVLAAGGEGPSSALGASTHDPELLGTRDPVAPEYASLAKPAPGDHPGPRTAPPIASGAGAMVGVPPSRARMASEAAVAERTRTKGSVQLRGQVREGSASASRRWVVLGVGTGIGKTYVARALVELLAARGRAVAGLKPVESGVGADGALDAATLCRASLHVKHPNPHPLYGLRDPVTPALAARREHVDIDLEKIRAWVDEAASAEPAMPLHTVIETAGGVFSPLSDGATNLELALALGAATWVLVASDRLGVLHDVSSTLEAMRARGVAPDYLVLSEPAQPDASTGTNATELRRHPAMLPIIELPRDATAPLEALIEPTSP
jgi:8-amino-7-oxononanoate synthase